MKTITSISAVEGYEDGKDIHKKHENHPRRLGEIRKAHHVGTKPSEYSLKSQLAPKCVISNIAETTKGRLSIQLGSRKRGRRERTQRKYTHEYICIQMEPGTSHGFR